MFLSRPAYSSSAGTAASYHACACWLALLSFEILLPTPIVLPGWLSRVIYASGTYTSADASLVQLGACLTYSFIVLRLLTDDPGSRNRVVKTG